LISSTSSPVITILSTYTAKMVIWIHLCRYCMISITLRVAHTTNNSPEPVHAHGDCFKPYKDFLRLHTFPLVCLFQNLEECPYGSLLLNHHHEEKHSSHLADVKATQSKLTVHEIKVLTVSIFSTGALVSS
jgi:hypothetical protein